MNQSCHRSKYQVSDIRHNAIFTLAIAMTVCLLLFGSAAVLAQDSTVENSSKLPGLSEAVWPDYERTSVYIEMSDGVKLAADIFRPAKDGVANDKPLPLLWTHHRYIRASMQGGNRIDAMRQGYLRNFVKRGYIVAAVDVRGGGASYGTFEGPFDPQETTDAYDIMEWFASQDWCDGNLGMYGGSYLGATQYMAAASGSKHLKAIIPSVAPGDLYAFCWPGGIYRDDFLKNWTDLTIMLDNQAMPAPVDDDPDSKLMQIARRDHTNNYNTDEEYSNLPYRDSYDERTQTKPNIDCSPLSYIDAISESGVAIYHLAGWMDCFTRDAWVLFANLENPQRIAMGPWFHQQRHEFDNFGEHLRWYDYWLKDIDNGIMDEPPINYYTFGAAKGERWQTAEEWPLTNTNNARIFFTEDDNPNDAKGSMSGMVQEQSEQIIEYQVDYSTSSGTRNRWRNGYGGQGGYGDMSENDEKGISFTSPVLEGNYIMTGHPIVHLWVSSSAADGDFFVYFEEIDEEGKSIYVTEGCLRASHRKVVDAPYEYFGLPWHRSFKADIESTTPLSDGPVELIIDLQPTSNIFDLGNRARITITCADSDNQQTPVLDPSPTVKIYLLGDHASYLDVPIIAVTQTDDQ